MKKSRENSAFRRAVNDYNYRTFVMGGFSLLASLAFAGYHIFLAVAYKTAWNAGMAVYYTSLSSIRAFVVGTEAAWKSHEKIQNNGKEKRKKLSVLIAFLLFFIDVALICPIILMISGQKTVHYSSIPAITIATYTTYKISVSAYNFVKTRTSRNENVATLKFLNFIDSLVSLLSLQYTLIITFGKMEGGIYILVCISSFVIWSAIVALSIGFLIRAIKTN